MPLNIVSVIILLQRHAAAAVIIRTLPVLTERIKEIAAFT
jgi:hypothetical protein